MIKRCFILLCVCLWVSQLWGEANQQAYLQANRLLQNGHYTDARDFLQKQIKKQKKESIWYWMQDDVLKALNKQDERILNLKQALGVKGLTHPDETRLRLAQAYFDAGKYTSADSLLKGIKQARQVRLLRASCALADSLVKHPANLQWKDMGDSVNTAFDNLWPYLSADGHTLYTTVVLGKTTDLDATENLQEDLYYCQLSPQGWTKASAVGKPLQSSENEGSACLSSNGKYLFFVACNQQSGSGCEIMYSIRTKQGWSKPYKASGGLSQFRWQSNPCISGNGNELYFTGIHRQSARGDKDLWRCDIAYQKDGSLRFSTPQCLSRTINTEGDEISPFLHPYGHLLYFSSNGRPGMGGFDVYYSVRNEDGSWGEAINMGYPLNTHHDEIGFVLNMTGTRGYLSCKRDGQPGNNRRIVEFALGDTAQVKAPFEGKGDRFELPNIYFDTDQATLTEASMPSLKALTEFLRIHGNYHILITGHTDNTGSEEHNQVLSQQRAEAVYRYLLGVGIPSERMRYEGRGSKEPRATNSTEQGRAHNRRMEVEVIR